MIPLKDNILLRQRFAYITFLLIGINAYVFYIQLRSIYLGDDSFMNFAFYSNQITFQSLFTFQFLHGGWIHILGNMVFLWVFGKAVEDRLGHIPYLFFYLASGAAGALIQTLFLHGDSPLIGASASVAGILGAYIIWFPNAQIKVLLPIIIYWTVITLPALVVLGLWFITNLFNGYASVVSADLSNVAYLAHVGGFLLGAVIALILPRHATKEVATPPSA